MSDEYIVELQHGCWLAPCVHDSCGRTLVKASAKRYKTRAAAAGALTRARRYRALSDARILRMDEVLTPAAPEEEG